MDPILFAQAAEVPADWARQASSIGAFALASLAPAALLMVTAYVRISVVLGLLRQALGSPQVPGNQILMALGLALTALVMAPVAERVHRDAIAPYAAGKLSALDAWNTGTAPVKDFMVKQIEATGHQHYLRELYDYAVPPAPDRVEPRYYDQLPFPVISAAFLLSEMTTALFIGFAIYLPFLVIDLVVAAILSALGLFLVPPSQVALPLKLVAFALAEGWWLVTDMLLRSFALH